MILQRIGALFILVLVRPDLISYSAPADDAESRKLIREYDKKVCRNEPSCDLTNSVQKDRLTLKKRDCMCDFECTEFGDCCMDSQYFNALPANRRTYFCHPYSEVYMVVSCASHYQNQSVIVSCEKGMHPLEENDFDLIIPVTNIEKRVTYANKYCALCNDERKFESWDFYAGCGEPVGEETSLVFPTQTSTSKTVSMAKSSRPVYARPEQDVVRKYESNTKANAILSSDDDFIGGCGTENSPCRGDDKPEHHHIPQVPSYEYPKFVKTHVLAQPRYGWSGGNSSLNIRIEIGGRFKRQQPASNKKINYAKYENQIDDLIKRAKYDTRSRKFIVTSNEGKNLVCRFNSTYPKAMESAVRTCVPHVISNCGGSGGSSCPSYTSIVYDTKTKTPYRNRECALCNSVQEDKLTGCLGGTRSAASKDLAKTGKKSQDSNLDQLSQSDAVSF